MAIQDRGQREFRQAARRFLLLAGALIVLILLGSISFAAVEGTSVAYGFVWTLDTITTLGTISSPGTPAVGSSWSRSSCSASVRLLTAWPPFLSSSSQGSSAAFSSYAAPRR